MQDSLSLIQMLTFISPNRGENKYRYYTESNVLDLQYIEVMKYVGFKLRDIKQILFNLHNCTGQDLENTKELVSHQTECIKKTIQVYLNILKLMSVAEEMLRKKKSPVYSKKIRSMIKQVLVDIKETQI